MKVYALFLIVLVLQSSDVCGQWFQTDGPYGKTAVNTIICKDSLILASTKCGTFSKHHQSEPWSLYSLKTISSWSLKGDSLFFCEYKYGSIKMINLSNPGNPPVQISPISTAYPLFADSCIYSSAWCGFTKFNLNGINYTLHNIGLPADTTWNPWSGTEIYVYVNSITYFNGYVYCGTNKGVFRNTPALGPWSGINDGLVQDTVTFINVIDSALYTGIRGKLYVSHNNGDNWLTLLEAETDVTCLWGSGSELYAGTKGNGILYSGDEGQNWVPINNGLTDLEILSLNFTGFNVVCGTGSSGFFRLSNGNWESENEKMICSSVTSMTKAGNKMIVNDNEKVYRLEESGKWHEITPVIPHGLIGSVCSMHDTVFLSLKSAGGSAMPLILYSTDYGDSWNFLVSQVPGLWTDPHSILSANGWLYTWQGGSLYFTNNLGGNWHNFPLPTYYSSPFYDVLLYNNIPFASAHGGGNLLKLNENGNWILCNTGAPSHGDVLMFASCDSALFAFFDSHQGMYVSYDQGNQWSMATYGLPLNIRIHEFASDKNSVFITNEYSVYYSSNFGQYWEDCTGELINQRPRALCVLNDTLYVSTAGREYGLSGNGIWKKGLKELPLKLPEISKQTENRIYPNPANNHFYIRDISGSASIRIFDLSGKELSVRLPDSNGMISVADLDNGVYFIQLIDGSRSGNAKLLVNH